MEETAVFEIIKGNPLCKGVTFSGGEPFAQAEGFAKLGKMLKEAGYEVAAYSGFTFEQLLAGTSAQRQLLETIDVLIDGPFLQAKKSLELSFRGSRNQRILDVPKSLAAGAAVSVEPGRWLGEY
jgi:anaerobic ribonucleoside-triphosphate reductase activating protein